MTQVPKPRKSAPNPLEENRTMFKRLTVSAAIVGTALMLLAVLPIASASAASPWWQVLSGSRPTNMWIPEPNEQEIQTELADFFGFENALAAKIRISGDVVGCLGTTGFVGTFLCEGETGFPPSGTAAELEAVLEAAFGSSSVDVTGGPVGGEPFHVKTATGAAPTIGLEPIFGSASTKVINPGGSGRLVVTATNLGDAPVDATTTPVTIADKLPEGVVATGVEAFGGVQGKAGTTDCTIEASDEVSCTFEGTLPSYEAIEVEIYVSLVGNPPVAGAPGEITVTSGNAPKAGAVQTVKVTPEPTPFGIEQFFSKSEEEGGAETAQAGKHPFQFTTTIQLNSGPVTPAPTRRDSVTEQPALPRNVSIALPPGLIGNARVLPQCDMATFLDIFDLHNLCPDESAVGVTSVTVVEGLNLGFVRLAVPVFNLAPGYGEPARFGFVAGGVPVVIGTAVDPDDDYRIIGQVRNVSQAAQFLSSTLTLWGAPGDPRHDNARGWNCVSRILEPSLPPCERPPNLAEDAFFRQPVSCASPLMTRARLEPWNVPLGTVVEETEDVNGSMSGCNQVPFDPKVSSSPTNKQASSPSGFDFRLDMPNGGLLSREATAEGQAKKVEVALPEGMTVNPSQAAGLGACSPADYARETVDSAPGEGCSEASKVGTVQVTTPLLEEEAKGSLYVATPYDNPFDSLLALYMVAKIPDRGILVKQAGEVRLDPVTGQLVTTFDNLPQIPFETFKLNFFEGTRAPLVMPSKCGAYDIVARFFPWHASDPDNPLPNEIITKTSSFTVDQGPNGGPCPSGIPAFNPGFTAGTMNNAAGSYSPFNARLTREDGEQEFSRFSMKLPPGVIGKLAGIPFCSDAGIAAAVARTGLRGGQEELDSPSCPAASQIGRTLVGAGVGQALSYAPGKVYLAGPYQGSKLSIVAIATAKVGPFDLGTVVIRQPLKINPETAEVTSDGTNSTPIPHILKGVVVHARDIRIYIDRPEFVLNPTNCERMTASSTVLGSGLDFASLTDDSTANVSSPFQAADCASLGLKPKLSLRLRGGTKRGDTPRLRAVLTARKGDANIGRAQVTLPHSAFLEQANIRTICTRVQFNAGSGNGEECPKGAIYGRARAVSPLLDEPLVGPVFLRSSDNPLPDLVAALHSPKVDINLVGKIDSVGVGRIRTTFASVPDAPVTKFVLEMQGGRKGLIVNSTNICRGTHRAIADFKGQNGRRHLFKPAVKAGCKGKKGGKRKQR